MEEEFLKDFDSYLIGTWLSSSDFESSMSKGTVSRGFGVTGDIGNHPRAVMCVSVCVWWACVTQGEDNWTLRERIRCSKM